LFVRLEGSRRIKWPEESVTLLHLERTVNAKNAIPADVDVEQSNTVNIYAGHNPRSFFRDEVDAC